MCEACIFHFAGPKPWDPASGGRAKLKLGTESDALFDHWAAAARQLPVTDTRCAALVARSNVSAAAAVAAASARGIREIFAERERAFDLYANGLRPRPASLGSRDKIKPASRPTISPTISTDHANHAAV